MELKKFDLHSLTRGIVGAIWLTPDHHSTLTKIVKREGRLFDQIVEERDFKYIDPTDFYAALAMSGTAFAEQTREVNNIDDLGSWSSTPQDHNFWRNFERLLKNGRRSFAENWDSSFDVPADVCEFSADDMAEGSSPEHGFRFKPLEVVPYDYRTDPTAAVVGVGATTEPETTGVNTMSLIASNKTALIAASQLKAGSVLNAAAVAALKKSGAVPMMLRGYLDSPLAAVVVANVANVAAGYTANPKVRQAASLMMQAAAVDVVNLVDIEGMIAKLIDDPIVAGALSSVAPE